MKEEIDRDGKIELITAQLRMLRPIMVDWDVDVLKQALKDIENHHSKREAIGFLVMSPTDYTQSVDKEKLQIKELCALISYLEVLHEYKDLYVKQQGEKANLEGLEKLFGGDNS